MVGRGRRCYFRQLLWLEPHRIRDKLHRLSHRNGNCNTGSTSLRIHVRRAGNRYPPAPQAPQPTPKRHLPRRRLFAGFSYLVESLFCTPGIHCGRCICSHSVPGSSGSRRIRCCIPDIPVHQHARHWRPVSSSALSSPLSVLQALFSTHASAAPRRLQPAQQDRRPRRRKGNLVAIPYAVWFYLRI